MLAAYLGTANGHLLGQDQEYFYRMAEAVALRGSFAIQPMTYEGVELAGARGVDGQFYGQYAPGLPVALAPVVLLGRALSAVTAVLRPDYVWQHQDDKDLGGRFLVSYFNAPVSAAVAALLVLFLLRLGYSAGAAAFTGIGFGLATLAWGQARVVFAEPLQALLVLLALSLAFRSTAIRAALAGTALALAILVKVTGGLALPALLLVSDSSGRRLWRSPAGLAGLILPCIAAVVLTGLYNIERFGSVFSTGYTTIAGAGLDFGGNPFTGLVGLLVSPGRGLFWYAPPVLAAILAARRFGVQQRMLAVPLLTLIVLWLLVHSFWKDWDAGWGWGPRYLLPVLPLVVAPLAASWADARLRRFALVTAAVGAVVQLPGATVDFMESGGRGAKLFAQQCLNCTEQGFVAWRDFSLTGSELLMHTRQLLDGKADLAWLTYGDTWVPMLSLGLVALLLVGGLALMIERPSDLLLFAASKELAGADRAVATNVVAHTSRKTRKAELRRRSRRSRA